jgi:hypothetical protein
MMTPMRDPCPPVVVVKNCDTGIGAPLAHQPALTHPNAGALAPNRGMSNQEMAAAWAAHTATSAPSPAIAAAAAKQQPITEAIADRLQSKTLLSCISGSAALFNQSPSMCIASPLANTTLKIANPLTGAVTQRDQAIPASVHINAMHNHSNVPVGVQFSAANGDGQVEDTVNGQLYNVTIPPGASVIFDTPRKVYENTAMIEGDLMNKYHDKPASVMMEGVINYPSLGKEGMSTVPANGPLAPLVRNNLQRWGGQEAAAIQVIEGQLLVPTPLVEYVTSQLSARLYSKVKPMPIEQLLSVKFVPHGNAWTNGDHFNAQIGAGLAELAHHKPIDVGVEWTIKYAPY